MLKTAAKVGELLNSRVADVAEIGAAQNWCSFLELHSIQGSKVRLRALLCRTESSKETLQSNTGFIKLIKVTPSPKWATDLHPLCCGSESVIPSHNSSKKPQIESSCHHVCKREHAPSSLQFLSLKCGSYQFAPFKDVSVWLRGSSNLLKNGAKD